MVGCPVSLLVGDISMDHDLMASQANNHNSSKDNKSISMNKRNRCSQY
jgi:hypothetical protein